MATHKTNKPNPYDKIERIILSTVYELEDENKRLKESLAIANAKLDWQISPLRIFSSNVSPKSVCGASNSYFTPLSSTVNFNYKLSLTDI